MTQRGLPNWREAGRGARPPARLFLLAGLIAAAIGTLALGGVAAAAEQGVSLSHPWMRTIIPSRPAAGYFTLSNNSATARALVGAESPACGMLMLHRSMSENGVEHMMMEKSVTVPAHGQVSFTPGGYHLMCMEPSPAMASGNSVSVTLKFADGGTITAAFPVRGAGGK